MNVQKALPQINVRKDIQQNVNSIISGKYILSPHLGSFCQHTQFITVASSFSRHEALKNLRKVPEKESCEP